MLLPCFAMYSGKYLPYPVLMNTPTLVVLAAGLGSRYGGLKQIDSVGRNDETLLDYASYDAVKNGFAKIVYIIRKDFEQDFRDRIFDRVARNCDAHYVFQSREALLTGEQIALSAARTKPWGTVHAVLCARKAVSSPFAVINADDYYGREAYATLGRHLASTPTDSGEHAMVGYVLERTMTRSGSVSRAICTVKDGYLVSMRENTKIFFDGPKVVSSIDGENRTLTGKEWVSMNFFGFMPDAFEAFDGFFRRFIEKNISSEKAESYLPEGASEIVTGGTGRIRFYTTEESWFGMTYPEDRQNVRNEISAKIDSGYYPQRLWER